MTTVHSDSDCLLRAGFSKRDITPDKPVPMWGYEALFRPNPLSCGVLDPLYAKALVIEANSRRLAVVGLDLGRAPTASVVEAIREAVRVRYGIDCLMLCASHTHHGPVLELRDEPGCGQGVYDDAVRYVSVLRDTLIEVVGEAASRLQPVRLGTASAQSALNRNRHSQRTYKPQDRTLTVVCLDDLSGKPLVVLVNYAAHPTLYPPAKQVFSADYPGVMMHAVADAIGGECIFIQGACGDLQVDIDDEKWGEQDFIYDVGERLAAEVLNVARVIRTEIPPSPSLLMEVKDFAFPSRIDFADPEVIAGFGQLYFPELARSAGGQYASNVVRPHLTTVLLNGLLAFAGVSGEFFCAHSLGLRAQLGGVPLVFAGYCNGHDMYFPTREAADEGGYGADPATAWAEVEAGETIMGAAASSLCRMLRRP